MQDRFAKKIYDQPSFQKLHLKFAALLQVQLQKNITYFLKVRHLEKKKKKRDCVYQIQSIWAMFKYTAF